MRQLAAMLVSIVAVMMSGICARADVTLYVDDDGTADFSTINDALDFAKAFVPHGERVIVRVNEGYYEEQLHIDRSDTSLIAESRPRFDRDGYLIGYQRPVTVFVRHELATDEDVVRIVADNVEIHGFRIDGGGEFPQDDFNAGIRVTGHVTGSSVGERIVRSFLVSACDIRGIGDSAFWVSQSEGRIERCSKLDPSIIGAFVTGADFALGPPPHVEIVGNVLANSDANIDVIGPVWEMSEGHNTHGDGGHSVLIEDNLLLNATNDVSPFLDGHHLNLLLWGDVINSPQNSFGALDLVFRGNQMGVSDGAAIKVRAGEDAKLMATGLITGHFEDNSLLPGVATSPVADFTMRLFEPWFPGKPGRYVYDHTFLLSDPDGLFSPDGYEADAGPERNRNLILVAP